MKTKPSKLKVDKQTVVSLNANEMNNVNGGMSGISAIACPSIIIITVTVQNTVKED